MRPALRTSASVRLWFLNTSSQDRLVRQLSAEGQRLGAIPIPAGERRQVDTSPGSIWVATDAGGTCQALYVTSDAPGLVMISMRATIGDPPQGAALPIPPAPGGLAITNFSGRLSYEPSGSGYRTTGTLTFTVNQPVSGSFRGQYERSTLGGNVTVNGATTVEVSIDQQSPACPDLHNPDRALLYDTTRTVVLTIGIRHGGTGCAFDPEGLTDRVRVAGDVLTTADPLPLSESASRR